MEDRPLLQAVHKPTDIRNLWHYTQQGSHPPTSNLSNEYDDAGEFDMPTRVAEYRSHVMGPPRVSCKTGAHGHWWACLWPTDVRFCVVLPLRGEERCGKGLAVELGTTVCRNLPRCRPALINW